MIELKHTHITFIGMAGVGKSTFGKKLAHHTAYPFIDTDKLIQAKLSMSIKNYIETQGEKEFQMIEESIISTLRLPPKCIISTGGSAIYSEKSMTFLKEKSHIVYLKDSIKNIKNRIKDFSKRGMILNNTSSLEELFNQRKPLYEKYADQIIEYPETFSINPLFKYILKELQ